MVSDPFPGLPIAVLAAGLRAHNISDCHYILYSEVTSCYYSLLDEVIMVNGLGRDSQLQSGPGQSNPGTAPEKEGDAYVFEELSFGMVSNRRTLR